MSLFDITEEEASNFLSAFTIMKFRKNDKFLERNKVCNQIGIIEQGLVKVAYEKNEKEIVFEFAYENNFIADYYSYVTQQVSEKEIISLEATTIYVISREQLNAIGQTHSYIEKMSRKMNELLFLKMHNRLKSFLTDSPAQRYQNLIAEKPDLANRIPQYLIASYLNVKPETISRIRRKLAGSIKS